jgi:hypothetical protein
MAHALAANFQPLGIGHLRAGSFIAGGINAIAALATLGVGSSAPLAPTTSNDPTQIGALMPR